MRLRGREHVVRRDRVVPERLAGRSQPGRGDGGEVHDGVGRSAERKQHAHRIVEVALRHQRERRDRVADEAHGLRARLSPDLLAVYETGVRYQMYHALALLAVALASERRPGTPVTVAGCCFAAGTLLFSGSLYLLAVTGMRWLGAVTPLGGSALILGWLAVAIALLRA